MLKKKSYPDPSHSAGLACRDSLLNWPICSPHFELTGSTEKNQRTSSPNSWFPAVLTVASPMLNTTSHVFLDGASSGSIKRKVRSSLAPACFTWSLAHGASLVYA